MRQLRVNFISPQYGREMKNEFSAVDDGRNSEAGGHRLRRMEAIPRADPRTELPRGEAWSTAPRGLWDRPRRPARSDFRRRATSVRSRAWLRCGNIRLHRTSRSPKN